MNFQFETIKTVLIKRLQRCENSIMTILAYPSITGSNCLSTLQDSAMRELLTQVRHARKCLSVGKQEQVNDEFQKIAERMNADYKEIFGSEDDLFPTGKEFSDPAAHWFALEFSNKKKIRKLEVEINILKEKMKESSEAYHRMADKFSQRIGADLQEKFDPNKPKMEWTPGTVHPVAGMKVYANHKKMGPFIGLLDKGSWLRYISDDLLMPVNEEDVKWLKHIS